MLEDDEYMSDLTEEDEDQAQQQTQSPSKRAKTRSGKGEATGYRIQGALPAPRPTSYNAQHLYEQLNSGDISLDADYQRDVVWPVAKQIGIIDSIFRNFYIPPVIFSVTYESDGSEKRICIDGKQRLTSIQKFMSGIIPHKDVFTGDKLFFKENPKRTERGKLLPAHYQKIFQSKQIVCIEYTNLSDTSEREIFHRVQLGMALTPAEKLQAVSSPSSRFIRTLVALYVHNQLEKHLEWDTSRGGDFRCVASAVYCIDKNAGVAPSMASLTKWLQQPDEPDEALCEDMHTTFKIFASIAKNSEYNSAFKLYDKKKLLKVSPAEFIMISVLIYRFKGKLTMSQLSEAVENMRWDIRGVEQDIRMNSRVFKHMLAFIQKLKASQLKSDSKSDVAAMAIKDVYSEDEVESVVDEDDDDVDQLDGGNDSKGKGKTPKRKRGSKNNDDDEDEEDYRPVKKTPAKSQRTPVKASKSSPNLSRSKQATSLSSPNNLSGSSQSSAPPPYSSQPPPQQRVHPDRLDAIRRAKAYEVQEQLPMHADPSYASQQMLNSQPTWSTDIPLRMGPGPMYQADLGRTLMERMGYAQAVPIPSPMQSQRYPTDPYARRDSDGFPPNTTGANRYAGSDNSYQRRHAS